MGRAVITAVCLALLATADAAEPMKLDMPMKGEMKKDGMKRGDVKKAAQKNQKQMNEMMERERKGG